MFLSPVPVWTGKDVFVCRQEADLVVTLCGIGGFKCVLWLLDCCFFLCVCFCFLTPSATLCLYTRHITMRSLPEIDYPANTVECSGRLQCHLLPSHDFQRTCLPDASCRIWFYSRYIRRGDDQFKTCHQSDHWTHVPGWVFLFIFNLCDFDYQRVLNCPITIGIAFPEDKWLWLLNDVAQMWPRCGAALVRVCARVWWFVRFKV